MPERPVGPFLRERLRYDHGFSLLARYAVDHGLPWKRFMREWDTSERNLVVAVLLEKGTECSSCGSASWQWEADPHAFQAVAVTCPGCAAKDRVRGGLEDAKQPGMSVRLITRDTAAKMSTGPRKRPMSARERARLQA